MSARNNNNSSGCGLIFDIVVVIGIASILANTAHYIYVGAQERWQVIIVALGTLGFCRCVFYFTHRKPLSYLQIKKLSKRYARKYIHSEYRFRKGPVVVDSEFKSSLDVTGRWYEIEESVQSFPAYIATLLKGKHHEWVVVAIEKKGCVCSMWVNKGIDSQSVSLNCDLEDIISRSKQEKAYSILRFHNHPNPNPSRYTTLLASNQDKKSASYCADYVCREGFNWFDFVCARGEFVKFYSKISDSFEVEGYSSSDFIDKTGISPEMDYNLQRKYHRDLGLFLTSVVTIIVLAVFFVTGKTKIDYDTGEFSAETESKEERNEDNAEGSTEKSEELYVSKVSRDGIEYEFDSVLNGYVVISGPDQEVVTIPESIDGIAVVAIGEEAFSKRATLNSINLPESIVEIRKDAFEWCESLESFSFPDKVSVVSEMASWNCSSLSNVMLNSSITSIEDNAFYNCSFSSVELPDTLTQIGDYAFEQCRNLKGIVIPEGVKSIGKKAFVWCENMEKIDLPNTLTDIGGGCFRNCESLKNIVIPPYVESLNWEIFVNCYSLQTVEVPASCELSLIDDKFNSCDATIVVY